MRQEAAILETLSEISGIPVDDLANDAVNWMRSYINDLPERRTGQVFDLLDIDKDNMGAFGNEIPRGYRRRTR